MTKNKKSGQAKQASPKTKAQSKPSLSSRGKLVENFKRILKEHTASKSYLPSTLKDIQKKLSLPDLHIENLEQALSDLVQSGEVTISQGRILGPKKEEEMIKGIIRLHPRGFGFIQPIGKKGSDEEVFIPKQMTFHSVDGDLVEVLVKGEPSPKGKEGRVISILERGRTHLAGTIQAVTSTGEGNLHVSILGSDHTILVEPGDVPFQVGDRVVVKVMAWGEKKGATQTVIKEFLSHIDDPKGDIVAAIEEFSLPKQFSQEVLDSVEKLGNRVKPSDRKGREDLTHLKTITIDPDTAKDFDDALSIEKHLDGSFSLAVHVADVSYYVPPNSPVDKEARRRLNSTYFPGTCIPMLPEVLSNELCSLKPKVQRLALTVHMSFSPSGELHDYRISRSVIKSAHRFTYKEARLVINGEKKSPYKKMLEEMVDLALILKHIRKERGSVELSLPDLVVKVNQEGTVDGMEWEEYDITHQLVEEFMLKANEVVASHLSKMGKTLTYRVHEKPDQEDLHEFVRLVRSFEISIPDEPTPLEIQKALDEASKQPFASFVVATYIRSMKLAIYSPDNIGHHGLALTHYCHFTSPIRRYPDLIIHRLLMEADVTEEEVKEVADIASIQERISSKAESSVKTLKKLRYLKNEPKEKHYKAYVSKVRPFGFSFEIVEVALEGFFGFEDLGDDYYYFDEKKRSITGRRSKESFFVGKEIDVIVKEIDLIHLQASWFYLSENVSRSLTKTKKSKSRRRS